MYKQKINKIFLNKQSIFNRNQRHYRVKKTVYNFKDY